VENQYAQGFAVNCLVWAADRLDLRRKTEVSSDEVIMLAKCSGIANKRAADNDSGGRLKI
jgi:hypothetical protein